MFTATKIDAVRAGVALAAMLAASMSQSVLAATYRWAGSSNRVYIEGTGNATLSALKAALPVAPLVQVDPANKIWMLSANLIITQGATLVLHGSAVGGDVNELRLKSDNVSGGFIYISGEPGNIDIDSTKIRSWTSNNNVDTEYTNFGRAFMRVRSLLATDGVTPLESRMDIVNSEISYLGYDAAESYGLVWKVNGDPGPDFGLYDAVNVYGDIRNSHIHHNFYGTYSFGLEGGQWLNNEVDHNVGYGFDPHDDSDDLLIDGNNVHDNGYHGIIASKRCDHVTISNNHSWNNAECGIMLHRSSNFGVISNNLSENNGDCGVALFASDHITVQNNTLTGNALYAIRLSMGAASNTVDTNEMANNGQYAIYFYRGSDTPEPGDDGRPDNNLFTNNNVHDNGGDGVKITDADDNVFRNNTFANNGSTFTIETSTNSKFDGNTIPSTAMFSVSGSSMYQSVVKFLHQPRIKLNLDSGGSAQFIDPDNAVFDTSAVLYTVSSAPPAGSVLDLDPTNFSSSGMVYKRDLRAVPSVGTVKVNPNQWHTTSDHAKTFTTQISDLGARVTYTVGDLLPGVSYDVFRGKSKIKTLVATASGRISFAVTPKSVSKLSYSVKPTPTGP